MTNAVDVRDLTREDLERNLILVQGFAKRLLKAVRDNASEGWRVRILVEKLVEHYAPQLNRDFHRGLVADAEKRVLAQARARNDRIWSEISPPAGPK